MISWLKKHFEDSKYVVQEYSLDFYPARVPLHCEKKNGDDKDEVVVEITTDDVITKDSFLPTKVIGGVEIREASPVSFYQYYFVQAKIYLAYPDYVKDDDGFEEFKKRCEDKGIGLLRVSKENVEEIAKPLSIIEQMIDKLELSDDKGKIEFLEYHLRNCLHYFVYYPEPDFKKRAIRYTPKNPDGSKEEKMRYMSYVLTDKVGQLSNLAYRRELGDFSHEYRDAKEEDCVIAENQIRELWKKYLGLNYPNVQTRVENILQRDKFYREHFVHQFQVFLIGCCILDAFYSKISEAFKEAYKCEIENVWLLASTFHDFSYGLQNFDIWLMQFFEDVLRIKQPQTKENLNTLNLDSAMIRETLYEDIVRIVSCFSFEDKQKGDLIRFFYEKAVKDRNHGVLSAISLLQLYYDQKGATINESGVLQAAIGIGFHDEDIWESLCGCQGYRRSSISLPADEEQCKNECSRDIRPMKRSRIFYEKISLNHDCKDMANLKCEKWEKTIMDQKVFKKIKFELNPIMFLLIYCDTVQDEGRIASSDDETKDRSSLEGIIIKTRNGKTTVDINLRSTKQEEKEDEIQRMAWCLRDERFRVKINDKIKTMNGSGGE